jgi:hypothetical protein
MQGGNAWFKAVCNRNTANWRSELPPAGAHPVQSVRVS